ALTCPKTCPWRPRTDPKRANASQREIENPPVRLQFTGGPGGTFRFLRAGLPAELSPPGGSSVLPPLREREAKTAAHALARLYAVAPREFTRTRNSLAAELRKSRDTDAARVVAGLRRPSAALWAVNQLARHARAPLERFLEAVDRLRRTQLSDPRGAMEAMRA